MWWSWLQLPSGFCPRTSCCHIDADDTVSLHWRVYHWSQKNHRNCWGRSDLGLKTRTRAFQEEVEVQFGSGIVASEGNAIHFEDPWESVFVFWGFFSLLIKWLAKELILLKLFCAEEAMLHLVSLTVLCFQRNWPWPTQQKLNARAPRADGRWQEWPLK